MDLHVNKYFYKTMNNTISKFTNTTLRTITTREANAGLAALACLGATANDSILVISDICTQKTTAAAVATLKPLPNCFRRRKRAA